MSNLPEPENGTHFDTTYGSPQHNGLPKDNDFLPEPSISDTHDNAKLEPMEHGESHSRSVYTVFTPRMRRFIIIMAASASFLSPLSGNIYYPALNMLSRDFHTSMANINLTLTTYMIMQGLAPSFVGDLADMVGRRPAYLLAFTVFLGANIGIALVPNFAGLLVLRCIQSAGSSGTIALANGVAADISTSSERGKYMGWALSGTMVGPAVGPIIGGLLSQYLGWRAIFWFLAILIGVFLVPFLVAFPETGRNVVGNGSIPPQSWNNSILGFLEQRRIIRSNETEESHKSRQAQKDEREALAALRPLRFPNPLGTIRILKEPDAAILLVYNSINFAAFYDLSASLPYLFEQTYGFNSLQIGLCFIPFGCGCLLAPIINGRLLTGDSQRSRDRLAYPSTENTQPDSKISRSNARVCQ